jgi:hypothetical protein
MPRKLKHTVNKVSSLRDLLIADVIALSVFSVVAIRKSRRDDISVEKISAVNKIPDNAVMTSAATHSLPKNALIVTDCFAALAMTVRVSDCFVVTSSFGRGSTSFALSKQAIPVFILYSFYCAGRTCEDNSNEVEPRPNKGLIASAGWLDCIRRLA